MLYHMTTSVLEEVKTALVTLESNNEEKGTPQHIRISICSLIVPPTDNAPVLCTLISELLNAIIIIIVSIIIVSDIITDIRRHKWNRSCCKYPRIKQKC